MATDDNHSANENHVPDDVPPTTPPWVKYLLLGLVVVVVLAVLIMVVVGGEHGPGRHGGSDSAPAGTMGSLLWQ